MNDSKKEVLTDEGDTRDRWRFYFEQLMNVENYKIETIVLQREETRIERIGEEEVVNAMKRMKGGKAVDTEDTPVETWRVIGRSGIASQKGTFEQIVETEQMPEEWRSSTLITFSNNKVDIQEYGNC